MQRKKIKAVFFDLDDTLVLTKNADLRAYEYVTTLAQQSHSHLDATRLIADWKGLFAVNPWDPEDKVPVEEWRAGLWLKALQSQGIDTYDTALELQESFRKTRLEHFQFPLGVVDLISELKEEGYLVAIITNGHAEIQRSKATACKASEHIETIIIGGEEILNGRTEKPDAGIFIKACELVGCQPHEAVIVGDSLQCDIQGGINAGLGATIWVNPGATVLSDDAPHPTHIVSSVLELPRILSTYLCYN